MTLRIGVVGFGKMGVLHSGIVNALEGSELVSVCEGDSLLGRIGAKLPRTSISIPTWLVACIS